VHRPLCLATLLTALFACRGGEGTTSVDGAIVDGQPAANADGQARIYVLGKPFCGGTVIADEWILTAAHCVQDRAPSEIRVRIGEGDLVAAAPAERAVSEAILHETFDRDRLRDDVALLRLAPDGPPPMSVALGACAEDMTRGRTVTLAGWGATDPRRERKSQSNILNEATAELLDCGSFERYQSLDPSRVLCVGDAEGRRRSCGGDSGGPLFVSDPDGTRRQIGIDSWGFRPCGEPGLPSVFTRIDRYLEWIHRTTNGAAGAICPSPL
jgi:secreted trypsin-like serine protease